MNERDLQEIKERAEEVNRVLGHGSHTQNLVENDFPKLIAEVEELTAEVEELRLELDNAGLCPHGTHYEDRGCDSCFGDGTEERRECSQCGTETWHRGEKCLRHDQMAPRPYELLKSELKELRVKIQAAEEEKSARVAEADGRIKAIESSCAVMREALEYVRGRLGSVNLGESLHKIDQALSSTAAHSSTVGGNETGVSEGNDERFEWQQPISKGENLFIEEKD